TELPVTFDNWRLAVSAAISLRSGRCWGGIFSRRLALKELTKSIMKQTCVFALAVFALTPSVSGQDGVPVIKAEVMSAFVWGEDSPSGAVSSTTQDPLTGNAIRMLSYAGIEVSSRIGFERVGTDRVG